MHPAVSLTVTLFMTLMIGMPLVGLLVSGRQKSDHNARIWFLAIALDSIQVPLIAARGMFESWWTMVLPGVIPVMFYMTLCTVLRRELGMSMQRPWLRIAQAGALYLGIVSLIYTVQQPADFSIALINNLIFVTFAGLLTWRSYQLASQSKSRGMWFVTLGFLISLAGYVVRAWVHMVYGQPTPVFGFGMVSNFQIWTVTMNLFLMTFGYLGYALEKAEKEKLRLAAEAIEAVTKEQIATKHAEQMTQLVAERDNMVMVNSRFLTLGALAVFNSAIVHEISQPLQAAMMCLDNLQSEDAENGGQLSVEIAQAVKIVEKIGKIISVLRNMMSQGKGQVERFDVVSAIREILPIIHGHARSRGVALEAQLPDAPLFADFNGVMLQRLILNLAANAFDAFKTAGTTEPRLTLVCERSPDPFSPSHDGIMLTVKDNGPGLPAEQLALLFKPFATQKAEGLGVGLALAQILMQKWGGHINATHNPEGGMRFDLWLPLASL